MVKTREYWLQLENQPWDASPWGVDRTSGKILTRRADELFRGVSEDVLRIRRYEENWAAPAALPVNPWDLTEPDNGGAAGAFPGAVLTAKVADEIKVHFRNMDQRANLPAEQRVHSLHAHGVQRRPIYDGAYPLSPPDLQQNNRRGDRIGPGESFTYLWSCPQKAAAGAWLFHDAALAGPQSTALGAFGVLLIRGPGEMEPDQPASALRRAGDVATAFSDVPKPPRQSEYVLVFHRLPGVGLCLNGRQTLGNTPTLVAGFGTRMRVHCLNATAAPLTVHIHGHRWERGDSYTDAEVLPAGGGATLSILSGSAENGGGMGEWLIDGAAAGDNIQGSLLVTAGGAVTLASG
ncbi:MAG: multicopper oxidase domain-containing protein [Anaerolineae bacterium]|nr:multicopper oxidase domain-containing protein [Anaerolineae bacterium]